MYTDFKEKAIEYVKQAVEEDNAGNYDEALKLYMYALEYFKTHLKYEKNPKAKETITNKVCATCAEEIRRKRVAHEVTTQLTLGLDADHAVQGVFGARRDVAWCYRQESPKSNQWEWKRRHRHQT